MQKVTVNGIQFIGKLKEKDGETILTDAMQTHIVDRSTIAEYLKRKNVDELDKPTKFSGQGTSVSISDFTDEQEMILEVCKSAMKLAKKKAEHGLANNLFDEYLGKF